MRNNGLDWHQQGMHRHSMHNGQFYELIRHPKRLTFAPVFSLNQHCTHLGKLSYAPRVIQSADSPFPSINKPFSADSGQTYQWSPEHLPKQFNLKYYHHEGNWVLAHSYNDTPSIIEFSMAAIYGIQTAGEDVPNRILAFTTRQMIESNPTGTETKAAKTQGASIINSVSSAPESNHYWFYQRDDTEIIRSKRVKQGGMSYLNSMKQTRLAYIPESLFIFGNGILLATIIPNFLALNPNIKSGLVYGGISVVVIGAIYKSLSIPVNYFIHSPPYADPEQEAAKRYNGLKQLLNHYLKHRNNHPHHNLLTSLLSDTEAPLGVIRYSTQHLKKSYRILIADYYEPLSNIRFKQQRKFFDQAVNRCTRYFNKNSCDSQNPEHLDFIKFYLTMCSTAEVSSCETLWKQNRSKVFWEIIVTQYDWTETGSPLGILNSNFHDHGIVPIIIINKKHVRFDLNVSEPWSGYIHSLLEKSWSKPPAPVLSVTGDKHRAFPEKDSISAYDNETQSLWVLPWQEDALIKITNLDNHHSIHPVILNKNHLTHPTSNRMIKWYQDNNVRVKECHEIDYDNLRDLCTKISDNNQKKFLTFLLNSRIKKSPWIAVYKPESSHGNNSQNNLYFRFSSRIHFRDLSINRLEKHIDSIIEFYGNNHSDLKKLIESNIITESLAEVGIVSVHNSIEKIPSSYYKNSYNLVFSSKGKSHNLFSECFMDKLQKDRLCTDSTECVLMMSGWKFDKSSTTLYSRHPLPIWVQDGKIYNTIPVNNPESTPVPSDMPDNQAMNTYKYDTAWQEMTRIELIPSSGSVININSNHLHLVSPEPIEQGFHHFNLTMLRNGQKYMDSCPVARKP